MNQIRELPSGNIIAEIWTGSEFTLAIDGENGELWGTGWNEHANLANGSFESSFSWVPMYEEKPISSPSQRMMLAAEAEEQEYAKISSRSSKECHPQRLVISRMWEGAVACGGGHCIAYSSTGR